MGHPRHHGIAHRAANHFRQGDRHHANSGRPAKVTALVLWPVHSAPVPRRGETVQSMSILNFLRLGAAQACLAPLLRRNWLTVIVLVFDIYRLSKLARASFLTDSDFLEAFDIRLMDPHDCHAQRPRAVLAMVARLACEAGLPQSPAVGIMSGTAKVGNAIAIMAYGEHGLIAFTEGLFEILDLGEIEAIAGHEIGHLLHRDSMKRVRRRFVMDMTRMALIVGFRRWSIVIWLAFDILASKWLDRLELEDEAGADWTGAELTSRNTMLRALWKLIDSIPNAKKICPGARHRLHRLRPIRFMAGKAALA